MKGQLSMEYLLIALVALSIIATSFIVLGKVRDNGEKGLRLSELRAFANELFTTIDELCALGNGNQKTIVPPLAVEISSHERANEWFIVVSDTANSLTHKTRCETASNGKFEKEIRILNDKSIIKVKNEK